MATLLLPETAHINPPLDLATKESLLTFVKSDGSTTILALSPLSAASKYHLESLLQYGEVGIINSAIFNPPKSKDPTDDREFMLYKKLPPELRIDIWKKFIRANPRRLMLSVSSSYHFMCLERNYPVPVQLQVNREIRSDAFNVHGFHELKWKSNTHGLVFNPELDMLVLDSMYAVNISAQVLQDAARASKVLGKIRSIAISYWRFDFDEFMESFKSYTNLELVFIIIPGGPQRKSWGTAEEPRVSEETEIMFEILDTNASSHEYWAMVPRFHTPTGQFENRFSGKIKHLHWVMSRVGGVTPQIRFVRAVEYMAQR